MKHSTCAIGPAALPSVESPASLVPSGWLAVVDVPAGLPSAAGSLLKLGPNPVMTGPAQ